jgi:hypothetical protein
MVISVVYGLYPDPLDPPGKIYVFDDSDVVRCPAAAALGDAPRSSTGTQCSASIVSTGNS